MEYIYTIRQMKISDKEAAEYICCNASEPMDLGSEEINQAFSQGALTVFCHYYVEKEPEHCFVVVDENDVPKGYVLCAVDFEKWKKVFTEEYMNVSQIPVVKGMGAGSIAALEPFAKEYPAHLHIDLLPELQRQGFGVKLMDALVDMLRKIGVSGVMLNVAADNEKGMNFYKKYGFALLAEGQQEVVFGLKI